MDFHTSFPACLDQGFEQGLTHGQPAGFEPCIVGVIYFGQHGIDAMRLHLFELGFPVVKGLACLRPQPDPVLWDCPWYGRFKCHCVGGGGQCCQSESGGLDKGSLIHGCSFVVISRFCCLRSVSTNPGHLPILP